MCCSTVSSKFVTKQIHSELFIIKQGMENQWWWKLLVSVFPCGHSQLGVPAKCNFCWYWSFFSVLVPYSWVESWHKHKLGSVSVYIVVSEHIWVRFMFVNADFVIFGCSVVFDGAQYTAWKCWQFTKCYVSSKILFVSCLFFTDCVSQWNNAVNAR